MINRTGIINNACELLQDLLDKEKQYSAINKRLRELQGDFAMHLLAIDDNIKCKLLSFLDKILCELPSYFLYGCSQNGSSTHECGTTYPIKSVDDIKQYAIKFSEVSND